MAQGHTQRTQQRIAHQGACGRLFEVLFSTRGQLKETVKHLQFLKKTDSQTTEVGRLCAAGFTAWDRLPCLPSSERLFPGSLGVARLLEILHAMHSSLLGRLAVIFSGQFQGFS